MFQEDTTLTEISTESIKVIGETTGISTLSEEAAKYLAEDASFRIKELIQSAKKFMENGKLTKLSTRDVDRALKLKGLEPIYGFSAPDHLPFRYGSGGGREVYFNEDKEVDLANIINQTIPKAPLAVSLKAHWLAIDGIQPKIPENPVTDTTTAGGSGAAGKTKVGAGGGDKSEAKNRNQSDELVHLKSVATHQLSVEQQLYYKEVTEACVGADERKRAEALQSLTVDTGLQPVLPRFSIFISEGIKLNVAQNNLALLIYLMRMMKSLIDNSAVNLERYLHELLPGMLSCVLAKKLCARPDTENHWALRDFASKVLSLLCKTYTSSVLNLQSRVASVLSDSLQNPRSPLATIYGALSTFSELGIEMVRAFVIPHCPMLGERLRPLERISGGTPDAEAGKNIRILITKMLTNAYKNNPNLSQHILHEKLGSYLAGLVFASIQSKYGGIQQVYPSMPGTPGAGGGTPSHLRSSGMMSPAVGY